MLVLLHGYRIDSLDYIAASIEVRDTQEAESLRCAVMGQDGGATDAWKES